MYIVDNIKSEILSYKKQLIDLEEALHINLLKDKLSELQFEVERPDFWDNLSYSTKIMQEIKLYENKIKKYNDIKALFEDVLTLIEMYEEENNDDLIEEIESEKENFIKLLSDSTLETLLTGEYDLNNAIISFHSGAGGTEAQDWVEMLYRMYMRWAERHNFKISTLDYLDGDEAGIKSASLLIEGLNAYGFLKSEAGVHRLVRISPFDSSGRRHTSFAAIEVMPEIDDSIEINIATEDLKVDTYRASGAGGQHINKTDSAVRITHLPTGVVVSCQTQRSQHQNRDYAMKMLKAKLIEIKEREHLEKIEDIKGVQKEIAWGAQIRSYVFMPYTLVKDHRTSYETGNVTATMDGDLDGFINAYLKSLSHDELNKN